MSRIAGTFESLGHDGRAAFLPFVTAGDPDIATSLSILSGLPQAGADLIELGIPFSDPMADGPINQASYLRALKSGATLSKVLDLVLQFRKSCDRTPIVLMGAYNPVHAYGSARLAKDASEAGVDGLLMVDLPVEEDTLLRAPCAEHGIDIIRFLAPTTDSKRLQAVLEGASGYLYYSSIAGVTGTKRFDIENARAAVSRIRSATRLPAVVGFGIRTPEEAAEVATVADGVVVGSSIVSRIANSVASGDPAEKLVTDVLDFTASLANSVHTARGARVVG